MATWSAEWTGCYPHLCSGEWRLYRDGERVSTDIPFQGDPACTRGEHLSWHFGGDSGWEEVWTSCVDGLEFDDWCERNGEWLASLADESEWRAVYDAFNAWDWRHGECGGCI